MARQLRIQFAGAFYHVISRGNEKKSIFWDSTDYNFFLFKLQKLSQEFEVLVYCYCLMDNHFHLLLQTKNPNLSAFMKRLLGDYSIRFNLRHDRVGHLFQGRYKAYVVDKDSYLLELSRYIHLNPCRARIVKCPESYKWSSMRQYCFEQVESFIDSKTILSLFADRKAYKQFVISGMCSEQNIFIEAVAGVILGSKDFVRELKDKYIKRDVKGISRKKELV